MTGGQSLARWLFVAIGAGALVTLAAFLPSPLVVFGLFDAPPSIAVRTPPALSMREMPPLSSFAEIQARPLFNADRKPDPGSGRGAPTVPAAASAQGELSEFRVVGIVADSSTQRAIVERPGARALKLAPGDQLAGWRVDKIDTGGIVVSKDGRSVRIGIPKTRPR